MQDPKVDFIAKWKAELLLLLEPKEADNRPAPDFSAEDDLLREIIGALRGGPVDRATWEKDLEKTLERMYLELYEGISDDACDDNYYARAGRVLDKLMRLDERNYIPASQALDELHVTTMKQLHSVLRAHREIRWRKPSPQRLMVHAADWKRYIAGLERQATEALDAAKDFQAAARERQESIRQKKLAP